MITKLIAPLLSLIALIPSAYASDPVGTCKLTVENDPSAAQTFELYDHAAVSFIGFPVYVKFKDLSGVEKNLQLSINFGSPSRSLAVSWMDADASFRPAGATFQIRPQIAGGRAALSKKVPVIFTYGNSELSPNPEVRLTCSLEKNAGRYIEPKDCPGGCEGGGASASN